MEDKILTLDAILKDLFSNKVCIQHLIELYIYRSDEQLPPLDFKTLRELPTNYSDPDVGCTYAGDMLWEVQFQDKTMPPLLFFVLEFQSYIDQSMVLRMMNYVVHCYLKYLKSQPTTQLTVQLPPLIPVVFYTGKREWTAPTKFRDMIASEVGYMGHQYIFYPDFEFQLIDINKLSLKDDDKNLVNKLINILRAKDISDLREMFDRLQSLLCELGLEPTFSAWGQLIMWSSKSIAKEDDTVTLCKTEYDNITRKTVAEALDNTGELSWRQRVLLEGQAKGEAIGEARGQAKGEAIGQAKGKIQGQYLLLSQLFNLRYGIPLPESWIEVHQLQADLVDKYLEIIYRSDTSEQCLKRLEEL